MYSYEKIFFNFNFNSIGNDLSHYHRSSIIFFWQKKWWDLKCYLLFINTTKERRTFCTCRSYEVCGTPTNRLILSDLEICKKNENNGKKKTKWFEWLTYYWLEKGKLWGWETEEIMHRSVWVDIKWKGKESDGKLFQIGEL